MTSVIMIFEMTRDYSIIVPLMISNLISFFISQRLQPEPIYEALALQEGVYLPTAESREELAGARVVSIMRTGSTLVGLDATLDQARTFLERQACNSWPAGEQGCVTGLITRRLLDSGGGSAKETAQEKAKDKTKDEKIRDILPAGTEYPFVHPDHPLNYVLETMRDAGVDALPVVSRGDIRRMLGVVTLADVLKTYGVASGQLAEARP